MKDYMRVTLLVKPGPGARRVVQTKLNEWVCEDRQPPFEPGSLLHYTIEHPDHDGVPCGSDHCEVCK